MSPAADGLAPTEPCAQHHGASLWSQDSESTEELSQVLPEVP